MTNPQRCQIHYLIAMVLFSVYGAQVCPFLDSLSPLQLVLPILLTFALQLVVRQRAWRWLAEQPVKQQVKLQFRLDLSLFVVGGIGLAAYNFLIYQFPFESGGKVLVGTLVLGFLIACELALHREQQLALQLAEQGAHIQPDSSPFPLTRKFSWFASACAVAVVGVVFLVINKDLEWLVHTGDSIPIQTAQRYILTEIAFIVGIVMAYVLAVILAYARNLKLFIETQNKALAAVARGDLNAQVPVTSNDEFGLMAAHTNATIQSLAERTAELHQTRDVSILGLASLAETRDNETGAHILRTQRYVKALAEEVRKLPQYSEQLDDETIDLLYKSAPLHDVGKVGIPDAILLKPGKLTDEEFEIMKGHARIGGEALRVAESQLGSNSFLRLAREIAESHHEKWDGSGYPRNLSGTDIPLSGRLMAVADVYDALISKRVYKPGMPHEKARAIIVEGRGKHFDPDIVDAFIILEQRFIEIAAAYDDAKHETEEVIA